MLDLETYLRFALALLAVLGLIAGASWLLRRYGFERALARPRHQGRRLNILEVRSIDPRHKLVLLSRDDCEHLIVVGPNGETLIESGLKPREQGSLEKEQLGQGASEVVDSEQAR